MEPASKPASVTRSDRHGVAYLGVLGALMGTLVVMMVLYSSMNQQTRRVRVLGTAGRGVNRVRGAVEQVRRKLEIDGALSRNFHLKVGGDLVQIHAHGPAPAGSDKYVVFARWNERDVSVTLVVDARLQSGKIGVLANQEILLGMGRPTEESVRRAILDRRARDLKLQMERHAAWARLRREGRLEEALDRFLRTTLDEGVPEADLDKIWASSTAIQRDPEDDTEREMVGN